ncbi:hypothetical protein FZC74_14950 [Sutcliffiella horikoshii]|uniref:Uncharacterized protein n=1 Tax=Sutcliffiella horikoshii TaxID=79883 RepID=A0AA95B554_9BACI|nr:hypothetical protein [Sutcliffiella horikoshii]TYS57725.1 hypothetical protein FZC74_14950 [Sutcliffiella horikoshii]
MSTLDKKREFENDKLNNDIEPSLKTKENDKGGEGDYKTIIQDIGESIVQFGEIASAIRESVVSMVSAMKPIIDYIDIEKLRVSFTGIVEGLKETSEDVQNYRKAIILLGYPPSVSLDISIMRQIGKEFAENQNVNLIEIIDDVMKDHYNAEKIQEMKLEWEDFDFLKERLPLLRQAMNAHNLGMYAITIPSLLSQMEGIIIEAFNLKQKVSGYQFEQLIEKLFPTGEGFSFAFENEIGNYYLKNILVPFQHGQKIKKDISRHAILHGGAKPADFAREEVSIKIILMVTNVILQVALLTEEEVARVRAELKWVKDQDKRSI